MFFFHHRAVSLMVLFAVALHLCWAVIIAFDAAAVNATAVSALFKYIHPPIILSAVIASAAALAAVALFTNIPWVVLLLLPQQLLLMGSASGCIEAIWLSQFADGVIRPRAFLAADQLYSVLAAVFHTIAIMAHANRIVRT